MVYIENSGLIIQKATIRVSTSFSLAPFFRKRFEGSFFSIRDSVHWRNYISFDNAGQGTLHKAKGKERGESQLFTYDNKEREIEEKGYNADIFRGLPYFEYFTPYYRMGKEEEWAKQWEKDGELINEAYRIGRLGCRSKKIRHRNLQGFKKTIFNFLDRQGKID